jgi:hypothetical protein
MEGNNDSKNLHTDAAQTRPDHGDENLPTVQIGIGEQPGELSPRRVVVHQVLPRLRQRLGLNLTQQLSRSTRQPPMTRAFLAPRVGWGGFEHSGRWDVGKGRSRRSNCGAVPNGEHSVASQASTPKSFHVPRVARIRGTHRARPVACTSDSNDGGSRRRDLLIAAVAALSFPSDAAQALETYSGVGLEIFTSGGESVKVVEAFGEAYAKREGPAWQAGVRVGDSLVEVDGKTPTELGGLAGVAEALRGANGTKVSVRVTRKVRREQVVEVLEVTRQEVEPSPRSCFVATCKRA